MKKGMILISIMLLVTLGLVGCASDKGDKKSSDDIVKPHVITAKEAKKMMDDSKLENGEKITIVDVRRIDEYKEGHIENALLIPVETIENEPPVELPDKDEVILIYCRSGNRSNQAAHKLAEMGYTKVYDFGGIIDWPYDIVKGE